MSEIRNKTSEEFAIPSGRFTVSLDLSCRALIRTSVRSEQRVRKAVEAASALSDAFFLRSGGFRQDSEGFHLVWHPVRGKFRKLTDLVTVWRGYPALYLPEVLDFARFLYRASSELDHQRPLRFLLSPPQIRLVTPEFGSPHWAIVPLPLEGAGLSDFLDADEISTVWVSGDELLGAASTDRAYLLGAVLCFCLISDLAPDDLPRWARFRRHLTFRVGNHADARRVVRSAVPDRMAPQAAMLADFICALLGPSLGRMTQAQALTELDKLQELFAAPALAVGWEAEGNNHRALALLNSFALTAPRDNVPWQTLARLRKAAGDSKGAAEAEKNMPLSPEERKGRTMTEIRESAGKGPEGRAEVEKAVARLKDPTITDIDPEEFLFLVYLNAHTLSKFEDSLRFLSREFDVQWHKVMAAVLSARCHAQCERWVETSRACREGRRVISNMPNGGGDRGRYARGYLNLLDGIAHIRVVESGFSVDYLNAALDRLSQVLPESRQYTDLAGPARAWLGVLVRTTSVSPALAAIHEKALALESSVRMDSNSSVGRNRPDLPWYNEAQIFASLRERTL